MACRHQRDRGAEIHRDRERTPRAPVPARASAWSSATRRSPRACRSSRQALAWVGHVQTRNRGTVGGSLAHADPSAELPLVAQMLGARMRPALARRRAHARSREVLLRADVRPRCGPTNASRKSTGRSGPSRVQVRPSPRSASATAILRSSPPPRRSRSTRTGAARARRSAWAESREHRSRFRRSPRGSSGTKLDDEAMTRRGRSGGRGMRSGQRPPRKRGLPAAPRRRARRAGASRRS